MKKALVAGGFLIALAVAARILAGRMERIDWATKIERLPDNTPPKWMFGNISAIRENTDRILELLQREQADRAGSDGEESTD